MNKNLLPWQLLTILALVLPTAYLALVWTTLPAQVPTHFGLDGQPDGYTSRDQMWLFTLAFPLGIAIFLSLLPHLDPKRRFDTSTANFQKLRLALVGFISGLAIHSLHLALHPGTAAGRGIGVLVGLFFALLGNYLTTVQPNYFVGIRTPWTLENTAVWARTHRVGGIVMCGVGLLLAGLTLVLPLAWIHPAMLVLILGVTLFFYAYSYIVFKQAERTSKLV